MLLDIVHFALIKYSFIDFHESRLPVLIVIMGENYIDDTTHHMGPDFLLNQDDIILVNK